MVKVYTLNKAQISRRRNLMGRPPACDCGCGHEFKIGDEVYSSESGRGKSTWRLPGCMDRLRTL